MHIFKNNFRKRKTRINSIDLITLTLCLKLIDEFSRFLNSFFTKTLIPSWDKFLNSE